MRAAIAVLFLIFFVPFGPHPADAKRAPPREYKVCNKTKETRELATRNYAGRGHYTSRGWVAIKPGACVDVAADSLHLERGKRPAGLDAKNPAKGCVTAEREFSVHSDSSNLEQACKRAGGRIVNFYNVRRDAKRINLR